jgi:phage-related protein
MGKCMSIRRFSAAWAVQEVKENDKSGTYRVIYTVETYAFTG